MSISVKATSFLDKFKSSNGRPLRVLFLGNIACNSYNNAKILRARGVDAYVITPNDFFVMSNPAWENQDVEIEFEKSFFPDWHGIGVTPEVPEWYVQGLMEPCIDYVGALMSGEKKQASLIRESMAFYERLTTSPHAYKNEWQSFLANNDDYYRPSPKYFATWLKGERPPNVAEHATRPAFTLPSLANVTKYFRRYFGAQFTWLKNNTIALRQFISSIAAHKTEFEEFASWEGAFFPIEKISERSNYPKLKFWREIYKRSLPNRIDDLQMADLTIWSSYAAKWRALFQHMDVVIATATYGAIPLLCGYKNYLTYEHGTLRDIPFAEDGQGRVCSLTYAFSKMTFVTNSDVLSQAKKLISNQSKIVCLPHAIDSDQLLSIGSQEKNNDPNTAVKLFAPARHDWAIKGNYKIIEAFAKIIKVQGDVKLFLVEWGGEVERTKKLIQDLGLTSSVEWMLPCSKPILRQHMRSSLAVLDQFELEAFGTTTVEALASAVPIITRVNEREMKNFFGETPPVINCSSPENIFENVVELIHNPEKKTVYGAKGKKWISEFHSADLICSRQLEAIADAF